MPGGRLAVSQARACAFGGGGGQAWAVGGSEGGTAARSRGGADDEAFGPGAEASLKIKLCRLISICSLHFCFTFQLFSGTCTPPLPLKFATEFRFAFPF
jgi:hypothetical protein